MDQLEMYFGFVIPELSLPLADSPPPDIKHLRTRILEIFRPLCSRCCQRDPKDVCNSGRP